MLSLNKLQDLLNIQNCTIKKVYEYDGLCMFIEIANYTTHDIFLMYIPSKYDIPTKDFPNVYTIKELEDNTDNEDEMNNIYNTIDLEIDVNDDENLKKNLEEKYNKEIKLNTKKTEDLAYLDNIKEQVRRVRYCIKNTDYKVAIQYDKYIVCLRRNDDIDKFITNEENTSSILKLLIVTDLEMFYMNKTKTLNDIHLIQEGIINVIQDLKVSHEKIFDQLVIKEKGINSKLKQIDVKVTTYNSEIKQLSALLDRINIIDENIRKENDKLIVKYKNDNNLSSDIEYAHIKNKHEKDLNNILKIKQKLIKNITEIKNQKNNTYLQIDKLLFENNILLNTVINNMKKISKYA